MPLFSALSISLTLYETEGDSAWVEVVNHRFSRFAWGVVAYNILVVLWGAWVRITGSGAGCGEHWPTCNGQLVPRSPSVQTLIEYSHRLTSGVCLVLSLAVFVWALRLFGPGHRVRRFAGWAFLF